MDHPLTLSIALIWAISVSLWAGDLQSAEERIDRLFSCAEPHALGPYLAIGRGFKGELAIRRGNAPAGIEDLQASLRELHAALYELLTTPLNLALVQGLSATGRPAEAIELTDDTIQSVEANRDLCYLPELLRVKGNLLLATPQADPDAAEACFHRSIELGRCQGALAWELRTVVDLAAALAARGQRERARALLRPVFDRFEDRSDTADLRSAATLLARLSDSDLAAPAQRHRRRR